MIAHSKPTLGKEEIRVMTRVVNSGQLAQGVRVRRFEEECAELVGRKHAVAVSSGTAALHLALGAVGVAPEEPVAVPSYACAALITAVTLQQGRPLLCDIRDDYNLDPAGVPEWVRVRIVPHLFGAIATLPPGGIAIEDIAQSMGGPCGRSSPIAITSFYATKLMTSGGEGGMLFTDDDDIAAYARDHRDYDNRDDFKVRYPYKMTELQAAVGRVQLRRLAQFIERRREIAEEYFHAFEFLWLRLPAPDQEVCFRYVVATPRRPDFETFLLEQGIEAKRPVFHPAHHYLGGVFPKSEQAYDECLSLPLYPLLTQDEVQHVIESVQRFFE